MSKGILVSSGADIDYASEMDMVLDTRLRGSLKIFKKLIIDPKSDLTFDPVDFYYYGTITHGLGYVPAVICFQDGFFGRGWQNQAAIIDSSANADTQVVYVQASSTKPIFLIIFGEKVSDT